MENKYPQYGAAPQQERKGVSRLASEIADLGLIWRETPNSDVGIDGQIEFVDADGFATGLVVAVQIKSGASYLGDKEDRIIYRPAEKHANYWREFPVPVLLAIHDPDSRQIFWTDARQQLRTAADADAIVIPKSQTVSTSVPAAFFATLRPIEKQLTEAEVISALAANVHNDAGFYLSFLELFGFGIVDIGRKLFFSMALCMEIAEARAAQYDVGVGVGQSAHDFIERYITFLASQGLIYYDYSDYLIDRDERQMAPTFLAPLTRRGQNVLAELQRLSGNLFHEALLRLDTSSVFSILQRLPAAEAFQKELRTTA
jgi:hypothetical protein